MLGGMKLENQNQKRASISTLNAADELAIPSCTGVVN